GIEYLAPVRQPLMRVAPHVKLLRRAADEDRDRLESKLCLACRLGGVGLRGLGRLGGVLGRGGSVELGLRVGLGGVELRLQFLDFRAGLLLLVLGSCLGLVGLGGGERLLCDRERGIGASLGQFKLAQRCRERGRLLHRKGGRVLRLLTRSRALLSFGWIVPMIGLFSTMPICIAHTKNVDNAARARAATIEPCSRAIVTRRAATSRRGTGSREVLTRETGADARHVPWRRRRRLASSH